VSQFLSRDLDSMLSAVGRAWGWLLAFGIISVLAGLVAIFWPGSALLVVAYIFGAYLLVGGVFWFVGAFAVPHESGWLRALQALLALLSFAVGIYLLRHPAYTVLIIAILLGFYWIIHGFIELFTGIGHPELPRRGWTIASGILGIIAGAIVLFYPSPSLLVLTIVLGVWLIIYGGMLIAGAFQLRSATHAVGAGPAPATSP
jgi:uncharacterized membrane protein HdeD (DUF308 family)